MLNHLILLLGFWKDKTRISLQILCLSDTGRTRHKERNKKPPLPQMTVSLIISKMNKWTSLSFSCLSSEHTQWHTKQARSHIFSSLSQGQTQLTSDLIWAFVLILFDLDNFLKKDCVLPNLNIIIPGSTVIIISPSICFHFSYPRIYSLYHCPVKHDMLFCVELGLLSASKPKTLNYVC